MNPWEVVGLVALGLLVVSVIAAVVRVRVFMGGLRRVREAHPDELVIATGLTEAGDWSAAQRVPVIAVVAGPDGLSFRDGADREVLQVAAADILSLELAPLNPRSRARPVRVERLSGGPVAFLAGSTPEQQLDSVIALRTALGRSEPRA